MKKKPEQLNEIVSNTSIDKRSCLDQVWFRKIWKIKY